MFVFTIYRNENTLVVNLPKRIRFNDIFMANMDRLMYKSLCLSNINTISIRCSDSIDYDKMSQAYIINVLSFINKQSNKKVFINVAFKNLIRNKVKTRRGENYKKETDIDRLAKDQSLEYYCFSGKESTDEPIKHVSSLLVESTISFDTGQIYDFLNTTIGEIFSNSRNHSDQEEVFFSSFVQKDEDNETYLYVSIIDYGTTIISNVRSFLNKKYLQGNECIFWAIQPSHTTRRGSGGHGLPMLINYLKAIKGDLYIFSGDAYYTLINGEIENTKKISDGIFLGTSVAFRVKLSNKVFVFMSDDGDNKVDSISLDNI